MAEFDDPSVPPSAKVGVPVSPLDTATDLPPNPARPIWRSPWCIAGIILAALVIAGIVIAAVVLSQRRLPLRGCAYTVENSSMCVDIGMWVGQPDAIHPSLHGAEWLQPGPNIIWKTASPQAVVHTLGPLLTTFNSSALHPGGTLWRSGVSPRIDAGRDIVLSSEMRTALVAAVDAAWVAGVPGAGASSAIARSQLARGVFESSVREDFKLLLTPERLVELIGDTAYASIVDELDSPLPCGLGEAGAQADTCSPSSIDLRPHSLLAPDAIAIRRTTATGRWIGWHIDAAARTVQVPLDDGSGDSTVGGQLLFALPNGTLVQHARLPGTLLSHDGDAAHAVTALTAGVRYGLFALRSRQQPAPQSL